LSKIEEPQLENILSYARDKQLSYTWLRTLMNDYVDFESITMTALQDGCEKYNVPRSFAKDIAPLYFNPVIYDDVRSVLTSLVTQKVKTGILSNGTHTMLQAGIEKNQLQELIDVVYSADEIKLYKPNFKVYNLVCIGASINAEEIMFVSSNQWDIAGAHRFGFQTVWLNRADLFRESLIGDEKISEISSAKELLDYV